MSFISADESLISKMENNMSISLIKKLGWQLYLVNPREHMYEKMEDLPNPTYVSQVFVRFVRAIIINSGLMLYNHISFCSRTVVANFLWSDMLGNNNQTFPRKGNNTAK